jgi:7-cyano-7-deazaguanine synthase
MSASSLVVLSGGLDSAVLLHKLAKSKVSLKAIYFDIGYLPSIPEKNSAKMFCHSLNVPLEIVDVRGIFSMVMGFVPIEVLGAGELDKGQPVPIPKTDRSQDKDYVSGFHVLLGLASYYAMLAKIKIVNVGIIREQVKYNKGLKGFLTSWAAQIEKLNPTHPFDLEAPFSSLSKTAVIKLGLELGVSLERTWSCYKPGPLHCGTCNGCLSRKHGFKYGRIPDRTMYVV